VLLICCVNVAALLLVRGNQRQGDAAIRAAIGATPARLARHALAECVLLTAAGTALGLLGAQWGIDLIMRLAPAELARAEAAAIDARVAIFAVLVSIATVIVAGFFPAVRHSRVRLEAVLRQSGRTPVKGGARLGEGIVSAQVAVAVVLLVAAGLMFYTLGKLARVGAGFDPSNLLTFRVALPPAVYNTPQSSPNFYASLLERLENLPGVAGATATHSVPLSGDHQNISFAKEGEPMIRPDGSLDTAELRRVFPSYLDVMKIPLKRGRFFNPADSVNLTRVVVINEAMASRFWPGEDPLGRKIAIGHIENGYPYEIAGIAGDVRHHGLHLGARPELYVPWPDDSMAVLVRTSIDPNALIAPVTEAVGALDPELPVHDARTMDEIVADSLGRTRFISTMLTSFAFAALLLAALGIYGVVSHTVAGRTSEIGLRMALGAEARTVLGMVLGQGMRPILVGLAAGLGGAALLSRVLESLLFEVSARDPLVFAGIAVLLIGVSLIACYIPARRAARIDPITALRYE
jgi:putative ABC transport system permease protein